MELKKNTFSIQRIIIIILNNILYEYVVHVFIEVFQSNGGGGVKMSKYAFKKKKIQ